MQWRRCYPCWHSVACGLACQHGFLPADVLQGHLFLQGKMTCLKRKSCMRPPRRSRSATGTTRRGCSRATSRSSRRRRCSSSSTPCRATRRRCWPRTSWSTAIGSSTRSSRCASRCSSSQRLFKHFNTASVHLWAAACLLLCSAVGPTCKPMNTALDSRRAHCLLAKAGL